jgi:hypothetical protein
MIPFHTIAKEDKRGYQGFGLASLLIIIIIMH